MWAQKVKEKVVELTSGDPRCQHHAYMCPSGHCKAGAALSDALARASPKAVGALEGCWRFKTSQFPSWIDWCSGQVEYVTKKIWLPREIRIFIPPKIKPTTSTCIWLGWLGDMELQIVMFIETRTPLPRGEPAWLSPDPSGSSQPRRVPLCAPLPKSQGKCSRILKWFPCGWGYQIKACWPFWPRRSNCRSSPPHFFILRAWYIL